MNEIVQRWVDSNVTEFENTLLWLATYDLESWSIIGKVLNRNSKGEVVRDFGSPVNNSYYEIIYAARNNMDDKQPVVGRAMFCMILMALAIKGEHVGMSEASTVLNLYDKLAQLNYLQMKGLIREALSYWVNKQRTGRMMERTIAATHWDASVLLKKLSDEMSHTNSRLETDDHVTEIVSQMLNQREPVASGRLSTGLLRLDHSLGGGFHIKDNNLVIAAPGVGKTVFATQLALHVALMRKLVVFITTEQPADQLTARLLSNWCNYSFSEVARGFDVRKLPEEIRSKFMRLVPIIANRLFVFDWRKKKKSVLGGGLEEEINYAEEKAQMPCSLLVLDWLGGGLTDDVKDDKDKKRLALQNTVDKMSDIAGKRDLCCVAMAQANRIKGTNNMYVGAGDIPENHTLDQTVTTVTGITGLYNQEARNKIKAGGSPGSVELYGEEQFFFVSKGRMSVNGHAATRRKFKYQRFEDRDN